MKWVGLLGLVLSAFSIFIHFLLARFTQMGVAEYESSVTIFSWRPVFEKPIPPTNVKSSIHTKISPFYPNFKCFFFLSLHCFGNPLYSGGVFVVQNFGFVLRKMTKGVVLHLVSFSAYGSSQMLCLFFVFLHVHGNWLNIELRCFLFIGLDLSVATFN